MTEQKQEGATPSPPPINFKITKMIVSIFSIPAGIIGVNIFKNPLVIGFLTIFVILAFVGLVVDVVCFFKRRKKFFTPEKRFVKKLSEVSFDAFLAAARSQDSFLSFTGRFYNVPQTFEYGAKSNDKSRHVSLSRRDYEQLSDDAAEGAELGLLTLEGKDVKGSNGIEIFRYSLKMKLIDEILERANKSPTN